MYKRFTLSELSTIQNNFIPHLYNIIKQEKCQNVNDFFKIAFNRWDEVMYFDRWNMSFRVMLEDNRLHFFDEIDSIEVEIPADHKWWLNDLIKGFITHKQRQTGQKTIKEILWECFLQGKFTEMMGKPYLVYDIETSLIGARLEDTEFYIWYWMSEIEPWKAEYHCITQDNLAEFVDMMLAFDGYIVWFNQMYFDNPVCVYNIFKDSDSREIAIKNLNEKSLDLFVFVRKMTWKRVWLNKLSENLVWLTKNLEWWWASVETLWKSRKDTWNQEILNQIKSYCENDVKMTVFLLYYLLFFKKLAIDWEEFLYDLPDFITLANSQWKIEDKNKDWFPVANWWQTWLF